MSVMRHSQSPSQSPYFEILVEGQSEVDFLGHIFKRKFGLTNEDFQIHPHQGKGTLPKNFQKTENLKDQSLLNQLPAKLKGYSYLPDNHCVLVLIDLDNDDEEKLKKKLDHFLKQLDKKPKNVFFFFAIEELESWMIADIEAVQKAYPAAKAGQLKKYPPDAICGAWEKLGQCIDGHSNNKNKKIEWAEKIAPYLNLEMPYSPSLKKMLDGIQNFINSSSVPDAHRKNI